MRIEKDGIVANKKRNSLTLREMNIRFPWLKIVVTVSLILIAAFGLQMALRGDFGKERNKQGLSEEIELSEGDKADEVGVKVELSEERKKEIRSEAEKVDLMIPKSQREEQLMGKKLIALTFDDGPFDQTTPKLLEILKSKNVPASFFVVGMMVERYPDLMKQEVAMGHDVGSHTMRHASLMSVSAEGLKEEAQAMNELFMRYGEKVPALMRPPYGAVNDLVRANIPQPLILWSIDPEDWKDKNTQRIVDKVTTKAFDGAIVLMHDIYETTVEAVGTIIDRLRADGYEFVTVTEMAKMRGIKLEKGWTYGALLP